MGVLESEELTSWTGDSSDAVTVGVQTQSFRLAVEHSAPYSELLNK